MSAPFDKFRPPRPSIELRERVLNAAFAAPIVQPHWIDLVWENRKFRIALTMAFGLSIAAQWLIRDHPIAHDRRPEIVEIDGFTMLADRFESNAPLPLEAAP